MHREYEATDEDSEIILTILDKDKKGYVNQEDIKVYMLKYLVRND